MDTAKFWLRNAPGEFQRFMESYLTVLRDEICIPYIDVVIVFSSKFEDHIEHVRKVLQRLRQHLFKKEVSCLGRIISSRSSPRSYKFSSCHCTERHLS